MNKFSPSHGSQYTEEKDLDESNNLESFRKIDRHLMKNRCIILPDNNLKAIWDFSSCIVILIFCILYPIFIAFEEYESHLLDIFFWMTDYWFFLDILINLNTSFFDKGVLVLERKKIFVKYLKSWLLIDILCSLPYFIVAAIVR